MTDFITYKASPTGSKFHKQLCLVRALMGPVGSGKSVTCCWEVMLRAMEQPADGNGIRRSRWAIIRNTYRELVDTTMETFFGWFPREMGVWRAQDVKWTFSTDLADGTVMYLEVLFRALDRPGDVKKLLSLELTGGWINEAREVPKAVLDMLLTRVGRYPSLSLGSDEGWYGVIMDTNPPDTDHWWYKLFEEDRPESYKLYRQPSGVSEQAENIANLRTGYYTNMIQGKDPEWVNVYVHGKYGFVMDGKPVYVEYKDNIHFMDEEYYPREGEPIFVGIDFGLTPAAVFGQRTKSGRWVVFDEIVTEDMGAVNFSKILRRHMLHQYPKHKFEIYGDPAGDIRAQTDERTPFEILHENGINAYPTYTNDFLIRREAVALPLGRLDFAGNTGFVLTPSAPMLRKGMAGGYKYKRMQVAGQERFHDVPDKNKYSHVCEALQYMMIGAGEGDNVVGGYTNKEIDYSETNKMVV